jgi:cytochrome c biogenesis protein CcmG/thiol:disulfide interchange protein DsbE
MGRIIAMNKILTIVVAIILSLGILFAGCNGGTSDDPWVGQPAPDFQFQGGDEQPTSLSDFQGSPVLLNFWASYCSPCVAEMPLLQQIYDEWQEKGLVLLAVNIQESSSDVGAFMQNKGLSFPVVLDSSGALAGQYGIQYIPTTFFIDSYGIIQEVQVGSFQSTAEIEASLNPLFD